jgi:ABC-type dipeptide/oligopeptide/nickel transport system ATPase subunit
MVEGYLQEYENAFILISHDIPFLNNVVNLIYHMENQELNRYVGEYDNFLNIYFVQLLLTRHRHITSRNTCLVMSNEILQISNFLLLTLVSRL